MFMVNFSGPCWAPPANPADTFLMSDTTPLSQKLHKDQLNYPILPYASKNETSKKDTSKDTALSGKGSPTLKGILKETEAPELPTPKSLTICESVPHKLILADSPPQMLQSLTYLERQRERKVLCDEDHNKAESSFILLDKELSKLFDVKKVLGSIQQKKRDLEKELAIVNKKIQAEQPRKKRQRKPLIQKPSLETIPEEEEGAVENDSLLSVPATTQSYWKQRETPKKGVHFSPDTQKKREKRRQSEYSKIARKAFKKMGKSILYDLKFSIRRRKGQRIPNIELSERACAREDVIDLFEALNEYFFGGRCLSLNKGSLSISRNRENRTN
jgi:hypothetical protein